MLGLKWAGGALASVTMGSAALAAPGAPATPITPAAPAVTAPAENHAFAGAAAAIRTATLANGLQIIVWPDHNIPNVVLYNWVHVGSR